MKIQLNAKKCLACAVSLMAVVGLTWLICSNSDKALDVNAYDDDGVNMLQNSEEIESLGVEVGETGELGAQEGEEYENNPLLENEILEGGVEDLPAYYNSRREYNVRNKNQNSEGMCWLYSNVTALEYALAKKYGEYYEVSNKHLDYLIADGSYVYKQSDKENIYFNRYLNVPGAYHRTDLGTSGNDNEFLYGVMNPLAIMSESDFTNVMKENDNRLVGIERYEDIWNDNIISSVKRNEILQTNGGGYAAYMEKQDFDKVNDASKVKYVVTGAKMASYDFDATRTSDSDTVKAIKTLINDYGAVKASVFGTSDRFEKCSYKKTEGTLSSYTFIIDGRSDEDQGLNCNANHGMAIVGWDDEWIYEYNGEEKRGAFILQNSWSEKDNEDRANPKWYLSYTSALSYLMYYDSVEEYDDHDYYYGPEDYKVQSIVPADDELIFELSLDNGVKIEEFTFGTISGVHNYDVYVSRDGTSDGFEKDGTFTTGSGMTKYEFNNDYDIDGDYAIKLKILDAESVSWTNRARGTINVMASKTYDRIVDPYVVEGRNSYLDFTAFRNNANKFKELFSDKYTVEVDTKTVKNKSVPYTGGKTRIYENGTLVATYTNILRGDVNGDGKRNVIDYIRIRKVLMGTGTLKGLSKIAGDLNKDGKINVIDYIRIRKILLTI